MQGCGYNRPRNATRCSDHIKLKTGGLGGGPSRLTQPFFSVSLVQ